ncbi:uncharacterized protein LOC116210819 [Punica granatum]|uniref:Uncharacterized protein LOC116210819 n=1 Tax=Punica granatum TaxID=22663 RepID=A0A6P8DTI1_PUNGR|nr:uncharacterized protein LOC116210819 [Punica granatum]
MRLWAGTSGIRSYPMSHWPSTTFTTSMTRRSSSATSRPIIPCSTVNSMPGSAILALPVPLTMGRHLMPSLMVYLAHSDTLPGVPPHWEGLKRIGGLQLRGSDSKGDLWPKALDQDR